MGYCVKTTSWVLRFHSLCFKAKKILCSLRQRNRWLLVVCGYDGFSNPLKDNSFTFFSIQFSNEKKNWSLCPVSHFTTFVSWVKRTNDSLDSYKVGPLCKMSKQQLNTRICKFNKPTFFLFTVDHSKHQMFILKSCTFFGGGGAI